MDNITLLKHILSILGIAVILTNLLVAIAKQVIEIRFDPVTKKKTHDLLVMLSALVSGVASCIWMTSIFLPSLTPMAISEAALLGLLSGEAAMGNYKWLTAFVGAITGGDAPVTPPDPPVPAGQPIDQSSV